jgi:hypothetical protein
MRTLSRGHVKAGFIFVADGCVLKILPSQECSDGQNAGRQEQNDNHGRGVTLRYYRPICRARQAPIGRRDRLPSPRSGNRDRAWPRTVDRNECKSALFSSPSRPSQFVLRAPASGNLSRAGKAAGTADFSCAQAATRGFMDRWLGDFRARKVSRICRHRDGTVIKMIFKSSHHERLRA